VIVRTLGTDGVGVGVGLLVGVGVGFLVGVGVGPVCWVGVGVGVGMSKLGVGVKRLLGDGESGTNEKRIGVGEGTAVG